MPAASEPSPSQLYEERATFVPLSHVNNIAMSAGDVEKQLPKFKFTEDAPKSYPFTGFQNFNIVTAEGMPVEFILSGKNLDVLVNKNFEKYGKKPRVEFKMDIRDNGEGLHVLKLLGNFLEGRIEQMYGQKVVVKPPVYNGLVSMPWAISYGKALDIEVQSSAAIFKANPMVNGEAVEKMLEANNGHDFDVRVLVRSWIMRDKEVLKAGYKLHVQKITAK
jgi:hypothetical protein